jgi:hypothetical protein
MESIQMLEQRQRVIGHGSGVAAIHLVAVEQRIKGFRDRSD